MDPVNILAKFEARSFTRYVPEIIAIGISGGSYEPRIYRKEGRRGSGMVLFKRALVSSYRSSIVTSHLSLRISDILPVLCAITPLSPPHL